MRPDVAIVSPYPKLGTRHGGPSGVASYTANLAHALADDGLAVSVIAPHEPGEPERGTDGPVDVRRAFAGGTTGSVRHALAAAHATGAPLAHLQHELFLYGGVRTVGGLWRGLATRPLPTVVTMHQVVAGSDVTGDYARMHRISVDPRVARAGLYAMQRGIPRRAEVTIVHERAFAELVPGARVVPHGVETPRPADDLARAAARSALQLSDDTMVALCFGFVAPYKGLEIALDAAALAGPAVRLVIAGGEHPRLAAQRDGYFAGLQARYGDIAAFPGYVADHDVTRWFHAADLALFPYPAPHAASGALALALAHHTPVLLSPRLARTVGASSELEMAGDPVGLARQLRELAGDATRRDALRARTTAMAQDRAWPSVARTHASIYEEVARAESASRWRLRAA